MNTIRAVFLVAVIVCKLDGSSGVDLGFLSPRIQEIFGPEYQTIVTYLMTSENGTLLNNCVSGTYDSQRLNKSCLKVIKDALVQLSQKSEFLLEDFEEEFCNIAEKSDRTEMYISYKNGNETGIVIYNTEKEGLERTGNLVTQGESYYVITDKMATRLFTIENSSNNTYSIGIYNRDPCSDEFKHENTLTTDAVIYFLTLDPSEKFIITGDHEKGQVFVASVTGDRHFQTDTFVPPDANVSDAHPHLITFHPIMKNLVGVAYSGLDMIMFLNFDPQTGHLTPAGINATVSPGSAPPGFVISDNGRFLYAIGTRSHKITVFKVIQDEQKISGFKNIQEVPAVPEGYNQSIKRDSHIYLHPTGQLLYALSYAFDSIAIYRVDEETGELSSPEFQSSGGKGVDNLAITSDGKLMVVPNQKTDNVALFNIDVEKGSLTQFNTLTDLKAPGFVHYASAIYQ